MEMNKVKKLTKNDRSMLTRAVTKIKAQDKIARTLYEFGLTNYYSFTNTTIYIKSMDELPIMIKKLHALFPGLERQGDVSTWSPYSDVAMIAWNYKYEDMIINIWLESKVDAMPDTILSPKCKFVKRVQETYVLECET